MKNAYGRNIRPSRAFTQAERAKFAIEIEKQHPGYLEENEKLQTMVWIMTGLRILYGLFYLYISLLFGFGMTESVMILAQAIFFMMWFSLMLHSTKLVTVMMLALRGYVIVQSGVSVLLSASYLPLSLIFTLILSIVLEFAAAVFCIYLLFNQTAAETVSLNVLLDRGTAHMVSTRNLEKEAAYQNPYTDEEDESGSEEKTGEEAKDEENKADFT